MSNHSVRAEPQAIQKVKQALVRQNLTSQSLPQLAGLDASILDRFFRGQPVRFETVAAIYSALNLTWEDGDTVALFSLDLFAARCREQSCAQLQERYGRIQLLDGRRAKAARIAPHVYTLEKLPLETYNSLPNLLQKFNAARDFDRFGLGERQGRIPGLDAATLCDKLLVSGKPGTGKSSFLRYLAIACCNGDFQGSSIPVLLELKALTRAEEPTPTCVQDWVLQAIAADDRDRAEQLLHQGRALILCDGLDEIPEAVRRTVQYQIRTFSQRYFKNRFVLASKTQILEYPFPAFECVEIAGFSLEEMRQFAEIWFAEVGESTAEARVLTRQFLHQLCKPENWRIAELASNPFCLSLACWLLRTHKTLPVYPCDLYEQGLKLFLHAQQQREPERASLQEGFALLCHLALRACDRAQLFFEREQVLADFTEFLQRTSPPDLSEQELHARAQNWLLQLEERDRLLCERTRGIYSFASVELHQHFVGRALFSRLKRQPFEGPFSRSTPKMWCDSFFDSLNRFPCADDLLLHLKRRTDEILSGEQKLQLFLAWVQRKASSVKTSYKPAAVRAFYLSLGIDRDLQPKLANPLDFSHAVDRAVKSPLHNRALACWLDANLAIAFRHDPLRHLEPDLALDLILDCLLVTSTHDLGFFLTFLEDRNLKIDQHFYESLQELNAQLGELDRLASQNRSEWAAKSQDWMETLRFAIIGYRNIGYTWRLNGREQQLLEQYLNAHKYSIEGLNRATNVSSQLQQKIEERLLLPTAPSFNNARPIDKKG